MESFSQLSTFLEGLISNPGDTQQLAQLNSRLERARPSFLSLLDVPAKNSKEKEELEKGLFTYNGQQHRCNKDFIAEALFLSTSLNASESFSASLLHKVLVNNGRPSAETALLLFYDERAALIACLQAIWRGALSADERVRGSGLQEILERETVELTRTRAEGLTSGRRAVTKSGEGIPWGSKILAAIDSSALTASTLRTSLSQALPPSNALTFGSSPAVLAKTSFSDELTQERISRLELERSALGQLLFLIAMARQLPTPDIINVTTWLINVSSKDGIAIYVLTALLASLDTSDEDATDSVYPLFTNRDFVSSFNLLVTTKEWGVKGIKSTVLLQWTLFLVAAARSVPDFESDTELYEEKVEAMVIEAIEGGVWTFLGKSVLSFKWDASIAKLWDDVGGCVQILGDGEYVVEERFQQYVTEQVESIVVAVISAMSSILRKLKNREEDSMFSSHRGGGHRPNRLGGDDRPVENRRDLEALFLLVATIYSDSPDSGLKFWTDSFNDPSSSASITSPGTSRLSSFLKWGTECRAPQIRRAYYEMLAALSTGPQCAAYAYEFLSSNSNLESSYHSPSTSTASWTALFGALDYYSSNLANQPSSSISNEGVPAEISPEETSLLLSFVRVLRQVVTYSDVARASLYDNQRYRPIPMLFSLLGRPVSIELKASLFGALAAFCRPGGQFGPDIARRTWIALEQSQILPTMAISQGRDARGGVGLLGGVGGVLRSQAPASIGGGILSELEEVEVPSRTFPGSIAFIELLSALLHAPTTLAPPQRAVDVDSRTIPDNLGSPYRLPGIEPYIQFVLDDVLLKAGSREYIDARERWEVTSKSLAFVEKCLSSYDLSSIASTSSSSRTPASLSHFLLHPGFDVLLRLLSGGKLLELVITIIISGVDAINQNLAGTPLFATCLLRCMRIIKRTFELQAVFLEVLLPSLVESDAQLPQARFSLMKHAVVLEQHLMYAGDAVAQIALLVSCTHDEIALLAVRVLSILAQTSLFDEVDKFRELSRTKLNRLVGFLESSTETLRINQAFADRLGAEVHESELDADLGLEREGDLTQAIRSAILDLLLINTRPDRLAPNIAHLLLGFNVHARSSEMNIDEPSTSATPVTCLHITLELLAQNIPDQSDAGTAQMAHLISRHPAFTAKCYQLIRQLCLHEYTSAAVSRYLRSRQQFFVRHCLSLPFKIPAASSGDLGEVTYAQGVRVVTSSAALCAILESEAWILESAALELNVLVSSDDRQRALMLVGALFGTSDLLDDDLPDFERERLEQASPRILEIFYAFDFAWLDAIAPTQSRLRHFADVRFDSCLRIDETGSSVYDFDVLHSLLSIARRDLQSKGALSTTEQQGEVKEEMRAIYENLVIENHRRAIQTSRHHALKAWRSVLDITLAKAFHLLPSDGRQELLLDLMDSILPPIAAQQTDQHISELLSGAAVLLMTKLRDEGVRGGIDATITDSSRTLSPERLLSVLRSVVEAILQPGVSAVVRGNLYAVLLNYLQYSTRSAPASLRSFVDDPMVVVQSEDTSFSVDVGSTAEGARRVKRRSILESGNSAILQGAIDRLLPTICRDAAVGHEVWRTVAFTLLDAVVLVAEEGRSMSRLLTIFTKQGYLQSFVGSLKDAEMDLLEALKPNPESLNALYIYEAQISFLTRLASTRVGAEKLMHVDLLSKLAQCDYLGARPQGDVSDREFDGFVPPTTERHHQLLLPALQLVVGTLVSFGAETALANRQARAFVAGQRETLLLALKDCAAIQTIASLQEAHLIVTLLSIVLPSVTEEDMNTLASFGGLHSALIGLSATLCGSQDWIERILPVSDSEREEDQTLIISLHGDVTMFSDHLENLIESLEAALLTYQSIATRKKAGSNAFRPVFLPSLKYIANMQVLSAPSLGSATVLIREICSTLQRRLQDVSDISETIDNFDSTAIEELEQALSIPTNDVLDMSEHRQYVLQELSALQTKSRARVASSLHLIELALLLYWRHVGFFLDPKRPDRDSATARPEFGLGLAESIKSRGTHSLTLMSPTLKADVADVFAPIAEKLSNLELSVRTVGSVIRARDAETFIGTIVRRLQDLVSSD